MVELRDNALEKSTFLVSCSWANLWLNLLRLGRLNKLDNFIEGVTHSVSVNFTRRYPIVSLLQIEVAVGLRNVRLPRPPLFWLDCFDF